MNQEVAELPEQDADGDRILMIAAMQEEFDSDLAAIDAEIAEIDDLYTSSKQILTDVSAASRKVSGSLGFVPKQTEQLVSIKGVKIQLLKTRLDIKNRRFAQKVKLVELQEKIKPKGGDTADEALVEAIAKRLSSDRDKNTYGATVNGTATEYEELCPDLDQLVDSISAEDAETRRQMILADSGVDILVFNATEEAEEATEDGVNMVCDEFGIVYLIDSDNVAYDKRDYEDEFPYPLDLKATIQRDKDDPSVMVGVIMGDELKVIPQNQIKLQPGVTYV